MNTDSIVVEQTYDVPVGVVWNAITDKEQMLQWYFGSIADLKPEVGFETEFDVQFEGQTYRHKWKVTEVVPEKRIAYDWRYVGYPGNSSVTWELSESPGGAKLTLTHMGHENLLIGQDDPHVRRKGCEAGWRYFLCESLKAFLGPHHP